MADALCGPSNALQQFQKHTTVDRTLQQDRSHARASPVQGFRSSPGPNAGVLDPEFEAFHAGFAPAPIPSLEGRGFAGSSSSHLPTFSPAEPVSGWAADFQRLHLGPTVSPIAQDQFRPQAPLNHNVTGGWHQDFLRQQAPIFEFASAPVSTSPFQPAPMYQPVGNGMMDGHGMQASTMFDNSSFAVPESVPPVVEEQPSMETFDDAAFERAFEAAKLNIADEASQMQQRPAEPQPEILVDDSALNLMGEQSLEDLDRIGADTIADSPEPASPESSPSDADELARTAGELLDSVSDNISEKFQQSSFLALMRQLRDREVLVEGDRMVPDPNLQGPGPTMTGAINGEDFLRVGEQAQASA
ncbi:MAG: hypothetical protein M1838_000791 [Thelocarpon superellum]|nr:MAG: hypothetical protein M1838_000791 [Thelocarpon superellum]